MRMRSTLLALSFGSALFAFVPACASDDNASTDDQLAGDSTDQLDSGKADAPGEYTYYRLAKLHFHCDNTTCGTMAVTRPNRTNLECADKSTQAQCNIFAIDWSNSGLLASEGAVLAQRIPYTDDDITNVIIKGHLEMRKQSPSPLSPSVSYLVVDEAWQGLGQSADGILARVKSTHIGCTSIPCQMFRAAKLNSTITALSVGVKYDDAGVTATQAAQYDAAMQGDDGILVSGTQYRVTSGGHTAYGRNATNVFTRVVTVSHPN